MIYPQSDGALFLESVGRKEDALLFAAYCRISGSAAISSLMSATWIASCPASLRRRPTSGERFASRSSSRCRRYNCQLALLCSGCCVFERSEDILAFQVGVVGQQLVDAGASGKLTEHRADGDASVADAGQAAHPVWIDSDSLLGHRARVPRQPPVTATTASMQGGIAANRRASGRFQALIRISAWNIDDMRGWFDLVSGSLDDPNPPTYRGFAKKRLMGFEPTTFCMAIRQRSTASFEPRSGLFTGLS